MEIPPAAAAFAALGQETRLAIFRILIQRGPDGLTAGQIASRLGVPTSMLSFHLGQLRQAAMVEVKRLERLQVYVAAYPTLEALLGFLAQDCCTESGSCQPYPAIRALRRSA